MTKKIINILFYIIAAFYIFMMLDLLLRFNLIFDTNRVITRSYNLIPFKTILNYARQSNHASFAIGNILGNIVVFIPYGLYLQVVQKHKVFTKSLLIVIITSIAIEIIQFVFGLGAADIDDVILNSIGGLIGILGYIFLKKALKEESRTNTAITIASLIIGVPIIYLYFTTVFDHMRL